MKIGRLFHGGDMSESTRAENSSGFMLGEGLEWMNTDCGWVRNRTTAHASTMADCSALY